MAGKVTDRDHGWRRILQLVKALDGGIYAKVGVLADTEQGGMHEPGGQLTVAEIAAVQEFGTQDKHVPQRSYLRSTFDKLRPELEQDSKKLVGKILDGAMDPVRAVGILGAKLAAETKKTITTGEGVPPPNAPSTLRRKLAAGAWNKGGAAQAAGQTPRTLVDTSRMVNAITHVVVDGQQVVPGQGGKKE